LQALDPAAREAHGRGQYVGQESFVTADEVVWLARASKVAARSRVLDLCCGTGGPALYLARKTGCNLVGIDHSPEAVHLARLAARMHRATLRTSFHQADATRLPVLGNFEAVLLLETMLAIPDKGALLQEVGRVLRPGGRFGLTLEEGQPLTPEERHLMPGGDAIYLIQENDLIALLESHGFRPVQVEDHTGQHAAMAWRLTAAYNRHRGALCRAMGTEACNEMLAEHRQWVTWLTARRVRKLAMVAERVH